MLTSICFVHSLEFDSIYPLREVPSEASLVKFKRLSIRSLA